MTGIPDDDEPTQPIEIASLREESQRYRAIFDAVGPVSMSSIEATERAICRRRRITYARVDRVWLRSEALKQLRKEGGK